MELDVTWSNVESRLRHVGEAGDVGHLPDCREDEILEELGLLRLGELTDEGQGLFMAQFVLEDADGAQAALRRVVQRTVVASAFCEALWGRGPVPTGGAISLLKRVTGSPSEQSAKRWLSLMNGAGLIRYNRRNPTLEVDWNPHALVSEKEDTERERQRGHVLSTSASYGNVLALREMLGAAESYLYWWEQHMGAKTLQVLYRNLAAEQIADLKLLSGPANVGADLRSDFKRFRSDVRETKGIEARWRVLSKKKARDIHGRFLISGGYARNLPPLNLILKGTNDEILPSEFGASNFERWWEEGTDLLHWRDED